MRLITNGKWINQHIKRMETWMEGGMKLMMDGKVGVKDG